MSYYDDTDAEIFDSLAYPDLDCEFQQLIQKVKKTAFEELQAENKRLKEELDLLKPIKEDYEKWKQEKASEIFKYKQALADVESRVKKARLKELLGDNFTKAYEITRKSVARDCPVCKNTKEIVFKDSLGRTYKVSCPYCFVNRHEYYAEELQLLEILEEDPSKSIFSRYYGRYGLGNKKWVYQETSDNIKFEDIRSCDAVFLSKEKADKYCEWLNNREHNKWLEEDKKLGLVD